MPSTKKVIAVRVPEDLHERARIKAVREKTSLQAVLLEALADWVKEDRRGTRAKEAHAQDASG